MTKQFVVHFHNAPWLRWLEVRECLHEERKIGHVLTMLSIESCFTGCPVKAYFEMFLLFDVFVLSLSSQKYIKQSITEFKTRERFNTQNVCTYKHMGNGLGQRSYCPELSLFRLRTSEVPLCAALHLFYPSSFIRPGWPSDPGYRSVESLFISMGFDALSTFVLPENREEEERSLIHVRKIKTDTRNSQFIWFWSMNMKIMFRSSACCPDF